MATADDEYAVRARAKAEELEAQLAAFKAQFKQYAEQHVNVETLDTATREKLEAEYKKARTEVKNSVQSLKMLTETAGAEAAKAFEEYLSEHPDPTTKRLPSASDGLPKYSCTVAVTSGETTFQLDTLGAVAKWLDLPVTDVHKAVATAAGVTPAGLAGIKTETELDITARNGATVHLRVTPKPRKPRSDSKGASTTVAEATTTDPAPDAAQGA